MKRRGPFALPTFSPLKVALFISLVYLLLGVVYIVLSGWLAANYSGTIDQLKHIELLKGILFIVVTAGLLFALAFFLFHRIAREELICSNQREALILSENRALAGVFASSVAHDINNVLMILEYSIAHLTPEKGKPYDHATLEELKKSNEKLQSLTRRLAEVSSSEAPDVFERLDLVQTVRESVDLARTHNRVKTCELSLDVDESIGMVGNPVLIHQMLLNLLINAADACGQDGKINVQVHRANKHCVVQVADNGPGVPPEEREAIFSPFYSTKADGKGLGLFSVRSCVDAHQGDIRIEESPMGGACFTILLPLDIERQPALASAPDREPV